MIPPCFIRLIRRTGFFRFQRDLRIPVRYSLQTCPINSNPPLAESNVLWMEFQRFLQRVQMFISSDLSHHTGKSCHYGSGILPDTGSESVSAPKKLSLMRLMPAIQSPAMMLFKLCRGENVRQVPLPIYNSRYVHYFQFAGSSQASHR